MAALRLALAALAALAACRAPAKQTLAGATRSSGDDVTLYRDAALIRQRVDLALPSTPTTVKIKLASGVTADQIVLLDRGGLTITGVHAPTTIAATTVEDVVEPSVEDDEQDAFQEVLGQGPEADVPLTKIVEPQLPDARTRAKPTEISLDVIAPRAGTYSIVVGYTSTRLRWDVAYTMTAAVARDRGKLRGALAIRNETGIVIRTSTARLIDADLVTWRTKTAEHLAAALVGGTKSSTLPATPRELGRMVLGDGETRVDLVTNSARRIRSVLVYDPIGTKLDNPGAAPLRDPTLGTVPKASTRVTESIEVARDVRGTQGLPAGPVRLLLHEPDGALGVLGESRLFDASTRVSDVDTIAVGTAGDVIGTRERREITIDEESRRLTEEFVITLDNKRAVPVEVLVREHLYRGQNWTLAYHSAPEATKDGPQQISLRTHVPAKSQIKLVYVVVYTWGQ